MAQCAGTAIHVELVMRDAQFAHRRHRHHGKGFVDFKQIDLVQRPAGLVQQLVQRADRGGGEPLRFLRMGGMGNDPCQWLQAAAAGFEPEANQVRLADGSAVSYQQLIVCPGLRLAWDKVEGLSDTLGRNGVSSNYRFDLAPYTWELVRGLKGGKALFTQPAMPIKCAGAPQKAMYLACDHWRRGGVLDRIDALIFLTEASKPTSGLRLVEFTLKVSLHLFNVACSHLLSRNPSEVIEPLGKFFTPLIQD